MPRQSEFIGKSHEKLTRDLLNSDQTQNDTEEQLSKLDKTNRDRVRIASEKSAEYIRQKTDFPIAEAEEVGDKLKAGSSDTDLRVFGPNGQRKPFSLKIDSGTTTNVRNPTLRSLSRGIFDQKLSELLTDEEHDRLGRLTSQYATGKIPSTMNGELLDIMEPKFIDFRNRNESALRKALLDEMRLETNLVACKVTGTANFDGFFSTNQPIFERFNSGDGKLDIYTKSTNNSSLFFALDNEDLLQIAMYGQSQGSESKPGARAVIRVAFGDAEELE
ncbi:hypothetical protein SAMN04488067_10448 [Halorubrum xinjiangense]|uniref:Uncharacterized protein n=1 Tax=Halorubrum xinjiangense TaxID=261291 RepID=A0A1G7KQN3_9EURY|nr:hypothetical protein [Halorubrum xinjiangense]SDF39406.1 hypothetical protein SAMN04488067_10448 [Halorubrum xinjiangense]